MSDREMKPWDLINPFQPRSPEDLVAYRLEICSSCEFYRPNRDRCAKCGCFMNLKTKLENARCPLKKW